MASPGGKGRVDPAALPNPAQRLSQPQKELRTSLVAGEDFSGFISPEELEVHPDPSASDLVHPPPPQIALLGTEGLGIPRACRDTGTPLSGHSS